MAAGFRSLLAPWLGGASGSAAVTQAGFNGLLGFWSGGASAGAAVVVEPSIPSGGAGRRKHGIAIESHGRILFFDSEDEAREWIEAQAPKQAKALRKIARRAVAAAGGVNLLAPIKFEAPTLVSGSPQLRALLELRASVLEAKFIDETARLIKAQDDEDEEVANLLMLIH